MLHKTHILFSRIKYSIMYGKKKKKINIVNHLLIDGEIQSNKITKKEKKVLLVVKKSVAKQDFLKHFNHTTKTSRQNYYSWVRLQYGGKCLARYTWPLYYTTSLYSGYMYNVYTGFIYVLVNWKKMTGFTYTMPFVWNVKHLFSGKVRKIFQNIVCFLSYMLHKWVPMCLQSVILYLFQIFTLVMLN